MTINETIFRLDGQVAVVTGGGGGIGAAICNLFANVGAKVACLDLEVAAAEETVASITAKGGTAIALPCDVTSEHSVQDAVKQTQEMLGLPTVLVNGAATLDETGTVLDIDLGEWNKVVNVNLTGTYLVSRSFLPGMITAGGGSIIHIASMHASVGRAGRVSYTSTKGALLQMARTMAADHAPEGIRVNTLSPGAVDTRRIAFRYGGTLPADVKQKAESKYLLNRFAHPDELATAALFLASKGSSYMTGADLLVDGGYCAV